jgi:hypothetical protein
MSVADHFAGDERDLPAEVDPETGLEVEPGTFTFTGDPQRGRELMAGYVPLCVACGVRHEGAAWSPEYGWHERLEPRR